MEIYKLALNSAPHAGIIRAQATWRGAVLGSVVIYDNKSALAEFVPALKRLMRPPEFPRR